MVVNFGEYKKELFSDTMDLVSTPSTKGTPFSFHKVYLWTFLFNAAFMP